MNARLAPLLIAPTALLDGNAVGPPDADGRRWRSRIREILRERGQGDLGGLLAFLAAAGVSAILAQRVEAGLTPPPAWYRARAARALGLPEAAVFEEIAAGSAA